MNNVEFTANLAQDKGGGIHNVNDSDPTISNASFLNNGAYEGGGIYNNYRSNSAIDKAVFKDNIAENAGGGIYNYTNQNDAENTIANSLFEGNVSPYGAGIYTIDTKSELAIASHKKSRSTAFCISIWYIQRINSLSYM